VDEVMTGERTPPTRGEQAAYWLRRCHGFRVDSPEGRVGVVEDILYGAEYDRPSALVVRTGLLKKRLELVAIEEVEAVYPRPERVILRARPGGRA
jgi:hypothetical protein